MGKRKEVVNRQYTDEFKVESVRLAESIGGNQAAKRLGVPDSSMWNWLRLSRAGKLKAMQGAGGQVKPGAVDLAAENERLRRELANAKMDLEIVKKAAAFFVRESR
jgi:transposase